MRKIIILVELLVHWNYWNYSRNSTWSKMQKHPIFCRAKLDFEKPYKSMHWNSVVEQQTIGRVQQTGGATITMLHRVTWILYFKLQAQKIDFNKVFIWKKQRLKVISLIHAVTFSDIFTKWNLLQLTKNPATLTILRSHQTVVNSAFLLG